MRDVCYTERLNRVKVCDEIAGILGVGPAAPSVVDVCFQHLCKQALISFAVENDMLLGENALLLAKITWVLCLKTVDFAIS